MKRWWQWTMLVVLAVVAVGCGTQEEDDPADRCIAERRCSAGDAEVCGTDGRWYPCALQAQCLGVAVDTTEAACDDAPGCSTMSCDTLDCPPGASLETYTDADGCTQCRCSESTCAIGDCSNITCADGSQATQEGWDQYDCPNCVCPDEPDPDLCGDDPCLASYCASRTAECYRESELATMGACPSPELPFYQEAEPFCQCTDDGCRKQPCQSSSDCPDQAVCVWHTDGGPASYCIAASCGELAADLDEMSERRDEVACQSDSDCTYFGSDHRCCSAYPIHVDQRDDMEYIEQLLYKTGCFEPNPPQCNDINCGAPAPLRCVAGTCQVQG